MSIDKFPHLGKVPPMPDNIKKILLDDISEEQLPILADHFERLQKEYSSNKEAVLAASEILVKIDKIMNLGGNISGEIMSAAADDYNYQKQA